MKRTPELKAIEEYGKARGILKERKEWMIYTEGRSEFSLRRYCLRELYRVDEAIRDAWQKRAVCKRWIPNHERKCGNCKYLLYSLGEHPCNICNSHNHNKWEPREY